MNKLKRFSWVIMVCILLVSSLLTMDVNATSGSIGITINNRPLKLDQPPISENGRTLVPLRAIFEGLGAEVEWDSNSQIITGIKGNTEVRLKIGSPVATVSKMEVKLDTPPKIINGRTLVPARFVAENLGATVEWDQANRMIIITGKEATVLDSVEEYIEIFTMVEELMVESLEIFTITLNMMEKGIDISNYVEQLLIVNQELQEAFTKLESIPAFSQSQYYMNNVLYLYGLGLRETGEVSKEIDHISEHLEKVETDFEKALEHFSVELEAYSKSQ